MDLRCHQGCLGSNWSRKSAIRLFVFYGKKTAQDCPDQHRRLDDPQRVADLVVREHNWRITDIWLQSCNYSADQQVWSCNSLKAKEC